MMYVTFKAVNYSLDIKTIDLRLFIIATIPFSKHILKFIIQYLGLLKCDRAHVLPMVTDQTPWNCLA